jgi:hypothetical protein
MCVNVVLYFIARIGGNGKGAMSVIPPSPNRSWVPGLSLDECDPAPLPEVIIKRLLKAAGKTHRSKAKSKALTSPVSHVSPANSDKLLTDTASSKYIEEHRHTQTTYGPLCASMYSELGWEDDVITKVGQALVRTLPREEGVRHRLVFHFVRHLKGIPECVAAGPQRLKPLVRQWHQMALPYILTKDFETTWLDFLDGWKRAKYSILEGPLAEIYEATVNATYPEIAEQYENESIRKLVGLCHQLQRLAGESPFFLTSRGAGAVLDVSHSVAAKWLKLLVADGVLELIR